MPDLAPPAAITAARMQNFAPRCDYLAVAPALDRAAKARGIDTPRQVRHWLAQLHHESLGFTRLEEALGYSAERLCAVWPSRFPSLMAARPFANSPRLIANKVYGGRMGNAGPDDGWRYRGRGWIMLTGHDAYAAVQAAGIGLPLADDPDLAAQPGAASRVAAWWWQAHGLNGIVAPDAGELPPAVAAAEMEARLRANEFDDVRQARKVVNGGTVGLPEVEALLLKAGAIWKG